MSIAKEQVEALLAFIDESPSAFHAVKSIENKLISFDFKALKETDIWSIKPGGRYYIIRDDSSIICFVLGKKRLTETGYRILGAHTDSPGLKIKPNAVKNSDGLLRLGVEIYGGPILATFTDRDLSIAGRISYKTEEGRIASKLVKFDQALLRLPNLAIHMNRKVNEEGLKLHKQNELALILSAAVEEQLSAKYLHELLANASGIDADKILSWELNVYDTQKGSFWGDQQQFYADSQLDNLASCHAGIHAMLNESTLDSDTTLVCALFDHEEIGSESTKGANGCFLPDTLQRIAFASNVNEEDYQRALAKSFMISADMAHAYQPNFPSAYEPEHKVTVNKGPVIKVNANHRYSSESISEAMFIQWCEMSDVPYQTYSHRTDIPCGSTIGPITSAKLGVRSIDVGNPMWAMHSIRESAGVEDHHYMIKVINTFFTAE